MVVIEKSPWTDGPEWTEDELDAMGRGICYGKGGGAPDPPDPAATAAAQGQANKEAVRESALVNQIGTRGPWGRTFYTGNVGDPDRTQVTELSPGGQQAYDQQVAIANQLLGYGNQLAAQVGQGPAEFNLDGLPNAPWNQDRSQAIADVEQATFDRSYNLLADDLAREEERLQTRLANQGITMGSDARRTEERNFREDRGRMLNDLSLAAVGAGRAEDSRLFNLGTQGRASALNERLLERTQPMNELAAILQGSPALGTPQGVAPGQYAVQPGDVQGATNMAYQGSMANWQQRQANQNAMWGNLFGLGGTLGAAFLSDARLKRGIRRIGTLRNGLPLYRYRYAWGGRERVGVMAQDCLNILPAAVVRVGDILAVDYRRVLEAARA